jgi:hypothetical protein
MVQDKTRVSDVELQAYCDQSRPHLVGAKVAPRGNAPEGLHGRTLRLLVSGTKGVAPGGVLAP